MSDERGLEKPNSPAQQPRFEHNYDRSKEPDCHGPSPYLTTTEMRPNPFNPGMKPTKKTAPSPDAAIMAFAVSVERVAEEARSLLVRKQKDYGPYNISRAPGGPLNGLRVRIFDKVSRINNLLDTGATPENESLRDSFIDLANYGLIALMVLDGVWPELPKEKK